MNAMRLSLLALLFCAPLLVAQNSRVLVEITPSGTSANPLPVEAGKTVHFTAKAYEASAGALREIPITAIQWSVVPVSFGTVTSTGDFTAAAAGASNLNGIILANVQAGGMTAQGIVVARLSAPQVSGSISGTVTDENGAPVPYAAILAEDVLRMSPMAIRFSTTAGVDGRYTLRVPVSGYILRASAQGFLPEYYDNAATSNAATAVTLTATNPTAAGIDFSLGRGGSINGRVVRASDGAPVRGAYVSVGDRATASNAGVIGAGAVSDDSGYYHITGLAAGDYRVMATRSGFSAQWYDRAADTASATKVQLAAGASASGIDFALLALPGISGTVVRASNAAPIANAVVSATGGGARYAATTDAQGAYTLSLPAGTYSVQASAAQFATEWYNEKSTGQAADPVIVTTGGVAGVNFTLDGWGGSISGTVRDTLGAPIAGANVQVASMSVASNAGVRMFLGAVTDAAGAYTVQGLPPGAYIVSARARGYLAEYYLDAATPKAATPVPVASQAVAGIDFSLGAGGGITGIVTDSATSAPIRNAVVTIRNAVNASALGARTDSTGRYTITGLATGDYILFAAAARFAGEFYGGARTAAGAVPVRVVAPALTPGIDFALDSLRRSTHPFTGSVVDATTMQPVPYPLVEAIDPQSGECVATSTGADGRYELWADAACVLRASGLGFSGSYAGGTRSWQESGSPAGGAPTGTTDFLLTPLAENGFATLRGFVIDADGRNAVAGAWIFATDAGGNERFAWTDGAGGFTIDGLASGAVQLNVTSVRYFSTENSITVAQQENGGTSILPIQRSDATLDAGRGAAPSSPVLAQNYPNPFNPSTTIAFSLPAAARVRLRVYSTLGAAVATLVDGPMEAGTHRVAWNAAGLPSGVYVCTLEAGGALLARRMLLAK